MDNIKPFVESYRGNYKIDFKKEIPEKEAYDSLFNLVGFVKALEKIDNRLKVEKKLSKKYKSRSKNDNIEMTTT